MVRDRWVQLPVQVIYRLPRRRCDLALEEGVGIGIARVLLSRASTWEAIPLHCRAVPVLPQHLVLAMSLRPVNPAPCSRLRANLILLALVGDLSVSAKRVKGQGEGDRFCVVVLRRPSRRGNGVVRPVARARSGVCRLGLIRPWELLGVISYLRPGSAPLW
jgi:hypothetical protein